MLGEAELPHAPRPQEPVVADAENEVEFLIRPRDIAVMSDRGRSTLVSLVEICSTTRAACRGGHAAGFRCIDLPVPPAPVR